MTFFIFVNLLKIKYELKKIYHNSHKSVNESNLFREILMQKEFIINSHLNLKMFNEI